MVAATSSSTAARVQYTALPPLAIPRPSATRMISAGRMLTASVHRNVGHETGVSANRKFSTLNGT